ncbi:DinB family protein [Sinomicrobium kalidii]|uniref:DinB family protein n=1 Tax=Sinomicrobium kalidii TaxID=2900738 RepID=UPI001E64BD35|nr:DinB family protein [Sinomicrobium kalidii]UGU18258.1 DinB family protein [Sinomicrobium kalidii]
MEEVISRLENQLKRAEAFLATASPEKLEYKPSEHKWSGKEILGHLVDSGVNNLQRFTEIQYPNNGIYRVRGYDQDELVKANNYQDARVEEILGLWMAVNTRILSIMKQQTGHMLSRKVIFENGEQADLRFLMKDYADHTEHHLKQIMR